MAEEFRIVWLLAIGLGLACLLGYAAQRFKMPPMLGYLLAGYLIGPHFPGFVADIGLAEQLANIGVALLMFSVGLDFNWKEIGKGKHIALSGVILISVLSIVAGMAYSRYLGESLLVGFVMGLALCGSSTFVIVKVLHDQNLLHTPQGHMVMGWTIVDDLISVVGLILLPVFAFQSSAMPLDLNTNIAYPILWVLLKMAALWIFLSYAGEKLVHAILKWTSKTRSHELFTLALLACVFFIAVGSSLFLGVSLALGAFIAGTIVGKTDLSHQAAANALPVRDAFSVLFFLSVGMLFNPLAVVKSPQLFFGILLLLLVLRPLFAFFVIRMAKYPAPIALTVGLAIAQIGEYSYVLAAEASNLNILPNHAYDIVVACSFLTIGINPLLFHFFRSISHRHVRSKLLEETTGDHTQAKEPTAESASRSFSPRAIVVGFGPIGERVCDYLRKKGYQAFVIDRNIDTVSLLKKESMESLCGDASQFPILEKAHIETALFLVITTPDFSVTQSIIRTARRMNPFVRIIARSHFSADLHHSPMWHDVMTVCDEEVSSEKFLSILHEQLQEKRP